MHAMPPGPRHRRTPRRHVGGQLHVPAPAAEQPVLLLRRLPRRDIPRCAEHTQLQAVPCQAHFAAGRRRGRRVPMPTRHVRVGRGGLPALPKGHLLACAGPRVHSMPQGHLHRCGGPNHARSMPPRVYIKAAACARAMHPCITIIISTVLYLCLET